MSKSHVQAYLTESLGCLWANRNIILANLSDIQAKWSDIQSNQSDIQANWNPDFYYD